MTKIQGLNLSYQVHNKVILQPTDFSFEAGQCVAILGPSGCGKSTLLKVLAGLILPTQGQVQKKFEHQSFVFQDPQLLDWRTTLENVQLPLELINSTYSMIPSTQKFAALEVLNLVGLVEAQDLFPHELSGGMKMRASMARALINKPDLIFLDEPFSSLDEISRENMQMTFRRLQVEFKFLSFFVTHSLSEALLLADQLVIFDKPGVLSKNYVSVQRTSNDIAIFKKSESFQNQLDQLKMRVGTLSL